MQEKVDVLLNYSRVDMHDDDFVAIDCDEVLQNIVAEHQM